MATGRTAVYLFCFARENLLPDAEVLKMDTRNPESGLSVLAADGIAAVYTMVPLDDFTGPEAESRLQDLDWIGPRAVFHERVIEEAAMHSPVYPVGFGTIYLTLNNLQKVMQKFRESIADFLENAAGKNEWAVKGYADKAKAAEVLMKQLAEEKRGKPASPGAQYLFEQRLRTTIFEKLETRLGETLSEAKRKLLPMSFDFRERQPLPGAATEEAAEMICNWAFLVRKPDEPRFENAIQALNDLYRDKGIFFRISGPWPPFSFAPSLAADSEAAT